MSIANAEREGDFSSPCKFTPCNFPIVFAGNYASAMIK